MANLRFIALSGTVSVTENLYLYEAEDKMMIIDCGVGFPDIEMHGVDLVIPDFSYVVKNKNKLAGIVVSQGHEDHIGALPFLLNEIKADIWAAPLVTEFLRDKFDDYKVKGVRINTFNPDNDEFRVGPFVVSPFRVTHSVPDSVGFAVDTPAGKIFHVPEHKVDQNPVDEMEFDFKRAQSLARSGNILFLASDCLGSNKPGYTPGERDIETNMLRIVQKAKQAVFMTAISSNIGRFQQMINVAQKTGRKVVLVGRSIQKKAEMAHELNYLKYPEGTVISIRDAEKLQPEKLMFIVAGCYGQVGSSLYRVAIGEHDRLEIMLGDTMVFSADPAPPYSKESEDFVIDAFIDKGVDVHYYDLNEGLYVSGHGSQSDIVELFNIVKPKYYIPIGGAIRYMHAYKQLAVANGANPNSVFTLKPGENVIFENGKARLGQKIPTRQVLVHGRGVGDVGKIVLGERSVLGNDGIAIAIVKLDGKGALPDIPKIMSRGFIFERIEQELLHEASRKLADGVKNLKKKDKKSIEELATDLLSSFFFERTGRRPMIVPVIIEV